MCGPFSFGPMVSVANLPLTLSLMPRSRSDEERGNSQITLNINAADSVHQQALPVSAQDFQKQKVDPASMRGDYSIPGAGLLEQDLHPDPMQQFEVWYWLLLATHDCLI